MNIKKLLTTRGFYIILFACVTIVGTSVVIRNMSRSVMDSMNAVLDEPAFVEMTYSDEYEDEEEYIEEDVNRSPEVAPVAAIPVGITESVIEPIPAVTSLRMPVNGNVIKQFSGDNLVFSNTMNDWRVHRGIDIDAPLGTQVRAAAAGVVERVFEDDMLGVVVVIDHGDGLQTLYASLQSVDFISAGTRVDAGDIIGGVGGTAISESADGPHLHFEVLRNGGQIDPASMMN
ncbi:MAG: M23 family metallopeptidase [Oscillospiraceae bacterium]|nr:M23 family metallopeptidase [Oscillospiraceae bacterium]